MKKTTTRVALVATALALAGAVLPAGASSANSVVEVNNCGTLNNRPAELILACADGNEYLNNIKWKSWKAKKARGTATYKVNDCDPTCAEGTVESYRARITLRSPKNQSGERVFSSLVIRFPKGGPAAEKKVTERLPRYVPSAAPQAPQTTPTPAAPVETVEPTPAATPAPSATVTPTPKPTPTPSASASPSVTPTAEATEQQEVISLEVIEQRRMSGRLRFIVEASSTAGGDRRGIKDVTVIRYNEYNAGLDYDATWAGPYQPTKWTAMTSCDSKNKDRIDVVVTSNSGKTETFRTVTRTGC